MADNVAITQGSGTTIATEDVSGVQHQKVKIEFGTDGVATMVSASDPLPVSATIDTTGLATNATDTNTATIAGAVSGSEMQVDIVTSALPSGASTSAKQPALGTAGTPSADVITVQGVTSMTALKVDGSAVTQPVSGTVTANLGATDNAVLDDIAADTEAIKTSLAGTLTVTGGGGGVEYTEDAAAAADPVGGALIMVRDDALSGQTTADGDNVAARGTDKGELYVKHADAIAVTNAGITTIAGAVSGTEMQVDVLTMPTTTVTATDLDIRPLVNTDVVTAELSAVDNAVLDTIAAKDFATQTTLAAMNAKMVTGTDIGDVTINNSTGAAAVNIQDGGNTITVDGTVGVSGTVAVTQSGTWDEVGINDSGNSITVDYATTGSGTATGALRVELPTNGTGVIATVGAVTAITNALPAGTNAIGKLAANSGVDIGDVTLTAGTAAVGSILPPDTDVTAHTNYARKYYTNAGAVTDGIVWSPAAGKRWHVVTMYIQTSAAATITLEDDKAGGDDPVWKGEIAANSGVTLSFTEHYPMASGEDAADLLVTTSAGPVYVTCVGYEV